MLVSAISQQDGSDSGIVNSPTTTINTANDTVFNSLKIFSEKRNLFSKDTTKVFDDINSWKYFCHSQIVGKKLDVIA